MDTTYSHRTLSQKLGVKSQMNVVFINPPKHYRTLLHDMPSDVTVSAIGTAKHDLIQFFVANELDLITRFPALKAGLKTNGALWICWRKGGVDSIDDNSIRLVVLSQGLVDVKVISINAVWSGLKCVYRLKNRTIGE